MMRKHGSLGEGAKPPGKLPEVLGADPPPEMFAILGSKIFLTTKNMLTNKGGIKTSVKISRDITV